jgi:hypothetical protein
MENQRLHLRLIQMRIIISGGKMQMDIGLENLEV